ncbi:class I adenylate-forming enzyme family protein [Robbsia sp. Bb-Pol-6]|uniref:Class I adenylate-forming enzyme family protein n=1 Tax=Robbsia betulipollinis TaxID=2981849 RepID=A0ABT3ZJP2_9BURK|nr:class I adenylate-forming enzyme family protein [Robbsia betulipollinis]MCY0386754.1 class I adenylate-forming enzyme family protein [Robbsia betulipollinis]
MTRTTNLGTMHDVTSVANRTAFFSLNEGDAQGEQGITFAALDDLANRIALRLRADPRDDGFALLPGERVVILAANSIRYIAAILGIMRAGGVVVPVNFKFPRPMTDFVIDDSGARLVFCDGARETAVPAHLPCIVFDAAAGGPGARDFDTVFAPRRDDRGFVATAPAPDDVAMILYTSGSTGTPKGVRLSHASHAWVVDTRLRDTPLHDERVLIAAPLYHMNALALALLSIAARATTVLMPQFDARRYIEAIDRFRCTWLTAVPPMIAMMLREQAALAKADLRCVTVVRMGSAPVSESLLAGIHALLPNARVINAYGTTEGGPVVFARAPDGCATPPLALGVAHPAVDVRLRAEPESARESTDPNPAKADSFTRSADDDAVAATGARQGVLELRSPALMLGYHQRPDLPLPFTEDGYYITGDVFRRDEAGFYYFVGRNDDMFVSGGENIFPGDVERMLETHPAIQQASVVGIDDEIKGTKPVAFVVRSVSDESALSEADVKTHALTHAPAYQHPRHVWFVDSLPLAATHKIDRRALREDAMRRLRAPFT